MLGDDFLKQLDVYVKHDLAYWSNWNLDKDAKIVWNYDHASDFWYGHTIGLVTRTAIQIFIDNYERNPTQLEDLAIIEKINEYSKEYKKCFEKLK